MPEKGKLTGLRARSRFAPALSPRLEKAHPRRKSLPARANEKKKKKRNVEGAGGKGGGGEGGNESKRLCFSLKRHPKRPYRLERGWRVGSRRDGTSGSPKKGKAL